MTKNPVNNINIVYLKITASRAYHRLEGKCRIYDTSGLNLESLQVKKIWEKIPSSQDAPTQFSMIVGVMFRHLSPSQKAQLNVYIRQLEGLQK